MNVRDDIRREELEYVIGHLREADERELAATTFEEVPLADHVLANQGAAYTIYDRDGNPAVVGGVGLMSPGVAQAWMFGTPRMREVGVTTTRQARRVLGAAFASGMAHRIQAISAEFHHEAHAWLARIGFRAERIMVQYGKGREDFLMFVLLDHYWSDGRSDYTVQPTTQLRGQPWQGPEIRM